MIEPLTLQSVLYPALSCYINIRELRAKDDGNACADGNCSSTLPLLCFTAAEKKNHSEDLLFGTGTMKLTTLLHPYH